MKGAGVKSVRHRGRYVAGARVFWTEERDAYLLEHYRGGGRGAAGRCAAALGTTANAVRARARMLGIMATSAHQRWTAEEDAAIIAAATGDGWDAGAMAAGLGRTADEVQARRLKLCGARRPHYRRWAAEEERLILALAGIVPAEQLAERVGRSEDSVSKRLQIRGVTAKDNRAAVHAAALRRVRELQILLAWSARYIGGDAAARALGISPAALVKRGAVECAAAVEAMAVAREGGRA